MATTQRIQQGDSPFKNMEHCGTKYWEKRWEIKATGFHIDNVHPMLVKHFTQLTDHKAKILVPLCGKTVDMIWLASNGHQVIGVEYVQSPVEEFFAENKIDYTTRQVNDFKLYESADKSIRIYNGDFFKFTVDYEGPIELVWDRASFVALTPSLRQNYARQIQSLLSDKFNYLMDTFEFDERIFPGPPHSVNFAEVKQLYGTKCKIEEIDFKMVLSGFPKNLCEKLSGENAAIEKVLFLTNV